MFSKFIKARTPAAKAEPAPAPLAEVAWDERLQAAMGDDMALLALAKDAAPMEIKLAAVQAMAGEETLRLAEREFRSHNRRVHSLAKRLYETGIERRKSRTRADELIQAAVAMVAEPVFPASRLVEMNQAWSALDSDLLEDVVKTRFAELQECLAQLLRERSEAKRSVDRWGANARQELARLDAARKQLAAAALEPGEILAAYAAACTEAKAALAEIPAFDGIAEADVNVIAAIGQALRAGLQDSAPIEARLKFLDELQQSPRQPPSPDSGEVADSEPIADSPAQRWQGLPPIADEGAASALDVRFEAWCRRQDREQEKRQADGRQRAAASEKAAQQSRVQSLKEAVAGAEEALAAGHLADALKHLPALQAGSETGDASPALLARIGRLQAEIVRLKGWQHWSSGQARDDLVAEAETLARSVAEAAESGSAPMPTKQIEKFIEQLRARWKELDRAGGPNNKAPWERFDGALKAAYVPVAAHLAQLKEARRENLKARECLLDALDKQDIAVDGSGAAPDWKGVARLLGHFHAEWRKLGPTQHTVPRKRQGALEERMKASVARLQEPLREVQRQAKAEREQFIARARALGESAQDRDALTRLRELQSQWQQHARQLPLSRAVENAMWTEFKAATDAVMSRRQEAHNERGAQMEANCAAREAVIKRIQELGPDQAAADIKRILAEAEAQWRQAGNVAGNQMARLESRYRAARDKALEHLAGSAQRKWQNSCDALVAKLALCNEIEAWSVDAAADLAQIEARWAALPALPAHWEQVLHGRFKAGIARSGDGDSAPTGDKLNDLLLQLECTLGIPSPDAFQAARRSLKLLWMKETMEGRLPASPAAAEIRDMSAAVFACTHVDAEQCRRLETIVAELRKSAPGGLER